MLAPFLGQGRPFVNKPQRWPVLLAIILALAVAIRVHGIETQSFWTDEGWAMALSRGPGLSDIVQTMTTDQHPPLYFALLHYWRSLIGDSEFSTRYLSMLWAIIEISLVYRIGADMFSPGAGAAAALIIAITGNNVFEAQDALPYTQYAALSALSALMYWRYIRRPEPRRGLGWMMSAIALLYTHYFGGFLLVAELIHALIFVRPRERLVGLLIRWGAICVAWLPWAFVVIAQAQTRFSNGLRTFSGLQNTWESASRLRLELLGSQFGLTGGLLLLGLVYIAYQQGLPRISLRPLKPVALAVLWLVVPIALVVLINQRYTVLLTRRIFVVTPVIGLLIGHGLLNLERTARLIVLAILLSVGVFTTDTYLAKPPWRTVARDIVRYGERDEPVIMNIAQNDWPLRFYLGQAAGTEPEALPLVSVWELKLYDGAHFEARLHDTLAAPRVVWLVTQNGANDPLLATLRQQGFVLTAGQPEIAPVNGEQFSTLYRLERVPPGKLAQFGSAIELVSARVNTTLPGSRLRVTLLWRALARPRKNYSVEVSVLNAGGGAVALNSSAPLNGQAMTLFWAKDDVRFDSQELALPAALMPGSYSVVVRLIDQADQSALPVSAPGPGDTDRFIVGTFSIP